jgi:hypothetical protein
VVEVVFVPNEPVDVPVTESVSDVEAGVVSVKVRLVVELGANEFMSTQTNDKTHVSVIVEEVESRRASAATTAM